MPVINTFKYTSQYLTSTIGDLAGGNHCSSYIFWINDYKNNSYLSWGGGQNYKVVTNAQGPTFSYKGSLPLYLTPSNPSSNITSSTYVAYTYAIFNTGLKSNYATSYFELRQHAIPKIDGTISYSVWVGDKVKLTYSFAYTPYNTKVKWCSSIENILTVESYTGNTGTFLANSTNDNQYGYFAGAYGYVVSQDDVGARTLADKGNIKVHNPIKDIVLCVNGNYHQYNRNSYTYYYHSNRSSSYTSTFKALAGSNISVNCYYVAAYNASGHNNSNTVAFNPFVTDAYIRGKSFTYSCNSGTGSYTGLADSVKKISIDLTNKEANTYFNVIINDYTWNINTIYLCTTTGIPSVSGVNKPNALYGYYMRLNINPVNLSLSLDRITVNPGDYITLTISTGGNDFGYVKSIDLVQYSSDTVITNFFTAPDDENVEPQIKLNGGSKQLIIPLNVTEGDYIVKVTPENGKAVYIDITIKDITLLIDLNEELLNKGDGSNNGHNYVDLGLPSGTMWATCNVGADSATSDGLLFQFGRTDGYAYGDTNNMFKTGEENYELTGNYYINPTTSGTEYGAGQILSLSDDMARANMGGDWIMPTMADLQELYNNTTKQVITINGKKGMLFTSNINNKSIFIVFAGYWDIDGCFFDSSGYHGNLFSCEVDPGDCEFAYNLYFNSDGDCDISETERSYGQSVRGVLKIALDEQTLTLTSGDGSHNGHNYIDLGLPSGTKWATCNVGGDLATSDGLLFQFGRTDGYYYGYTNNTFTTEAENERMTGNKYINPTTSGTEYNIGDILSLEDDAAHINMGGKWKMPTKEDLEELYDNTKQEIVTINGKEGMLFTSNINNKSIFVVFAGCWSCYNGHFDSSGSEGFLMSSEVYSDDFIYSWNIYICIDESCGTDYFYRAYGQSVRGVLK